MGKILNSCSHPWSKGITNHSKIRSQRKHDKRKPTISKREIGHKACSKSGRAFQS